MTGRRFAGKSIIVTGAASGIGRATALRLGSEGASVLAVDLNEAGLSETATMAYGSNFRTFVANVAERRTPQQIVKTAVEAYGRLDHLVNNAGIGGRGGGAADAPDEDWDALIDMNISSVFRMSREALPHLPRPGGRIVQISSVFGLVGFPGSAAYAAAKGAVAQLTRQMAADYAAEGINVNAVAPGVIDTGMTADNIRNNAWYQEAMIKNTPMGVGKPDDIAGVVAFLLSDDARYINGQVIPVDGGWLATRYWPRD